MGLLPTKRPNHNSTDDAHQVVDDGCPGHGDEATLGVEKRRRQCEDAVGGDLDHEPAQQRGGVGAFERHRVEELGVRVRIERGQAMMKTGAKTRASAVETTRTTMDTEITAEMEVKASSLERLDSWSTKTGMNVAESTPPSTMS